MTISLLADYFILKYDEANHVLIHEWTVSPSSEEFREGMDALITAFDDFKTGKLVYDVRQLSALRFGDLQWMRTDWLPRAREEGFSNAGVVVSPHILNTKPDNIPQNSGNNSFGNNFDNIESAVAWLVQLPVK